MDRRSLTTIPGWFWPTDIELFDWFLSWQERTGAAGDLAELGCYLGRSAVVIGDHQQKGETFTVIDLFEDPSANVANSAENARQYVGLSQAAFEENYRRMLGTLPVVIRGYSYDILAHASHRSHRFVHIDASHLYDNIRGDIIAAKTLLAPEGIVVLDDIREAHTPGVWAAVWEAVIRDHLQPIVVSEHKMYATWGDSIAWQDHLLHSMPRNLHWEEQQVLGRLLLRVWTEPQSAGSLRRIVAAATPPAVLRRADRALERWRSRRGSDGNPLPARVVPPQAPSPLRGVVARSTHRTTSSQTTLNRVEPV